MNPLSAIERDRIIDGIKSQAFDLMVIGGGITGAGIALDASSRGLKTLLVEKNDFSSGTSSRSTKLIHGGLRYLKQFEIGLVHEVGRERAILHKLAPHLVKAEKMLLPFIKGGNFGYFLTSIGLKVYDFLAGVEGEDQRVMLSKDEALGLEPLLDPDTLEGAGLYAEYRTDDARLTIEVIKTAVKRYHATCLNYLEAVDFIYDHGQVVGAQIKDVISGDRFEVKATTVVSAAGPWVDELRRIDQSLEGKRLRLTKGVHIVVDHDKFPVKQALYFDVPDGRMIFAIPRGNITYIGTTDTEYNGSKERIPIEVKDVDYLINAVNHAFPNLNLNKNDVQSGWAGLRPLIHEDGKSPSELSRKDEIFIARSGLISIAGGKLTGYRQMAKRIVDTVIKQNQKFQEMSIKDCYTDKIVLFGGTFKNASEVKKYLADLSDQYSDINYAYLYYLVNNYGKQTDVLLDNAKDFTERELLMSEINFCIENELTVEPTDFLVRRSGRMYFDINSVFQYQELILIHYSLVFGWNEEMKEKVAGKLHDAIEQATVYHA